MSSKNPTCSHCGKPLKYQDCFACNGKGYAQGLAFFKKECEICHGKGQIWRCEDEFKHIVEDFKAAHQGEGDAPVQPLKRRHTTNAEEIPDWGHAPLRPIHLENPWNPIGLTGALTNDTPHNLHSPKHRLNRHTPIDRHAIKK